MFFGCSSFSNGTLSFFPQILLLSLISTGFHQESDGDDDDNGDDGDGDDDDDHDDGGDDDDGDDGDGDDDDGDYNGDDVYKRIQFAKQ